MSRLLSFVAGAVTVGIVVAVLSNISYADTFSIGTRIAEAFVAGQRAKQPAN